MPISQYKCHDCAAIFEYLISSEFLVDLDCVSCGSTKIIKTAATSFYPNKTFCPHDKVLNTEILKTKLSGILSDESQRCGGCGTDGAPGRCNTNGGGCGGGGGGGGGCSCKKKVSNPISNEKLSLDIYEKKPF